MTNQVKLHVGYIGKTREGKRVEIVEGNHPYLPFKGDNGKGYYTVGRCGGYESPNDIIGPWADDATKYETGVWYGWNGGECPVHDLTKVDVKLRDGEEYYNRNARFWTWNDDHDGTIIAFRIVTPYVEPEPKLECWVLKNDNGITADSDKDYLLYLQRQDGGTIHRMIEADDQ